MNVSATREQAYVYAIGSAALVYTMAKACSMGNIAQCTCANESGSLPNEEFKWGGCADNVKWGMKFAKRFIDTIERYNFKNHKFMENLQDKRIRKAKNYVSAMNLHNNRVGRKVQNFIIRF